MNRSQAKKRYPPRPQCASAGQEVIGVAGYRRSSTTIPAMIVSFNIAARIRGTVVVKR
ncbi:hypothetical protein [Afipia sp. GAS231]|uniref:hypothetical protein n=1 Tax=Afipia sp. GAS231 TaxID=1882747 RepID=UPI0012FAF15D|nr:hypothetical protein [Afipia sp. GAS231]